MRRRYLGGVCTDLVDELGTESTDDLPEVANGLDMARFKDKAWQVLKAHEDHLALRRLRRGQALTPADVVDRSACWRTQAVRRS